MSDQVRTVATATFRLTEEYPLDWRLGFVRDNRVFFFEEDPKDIYYDDWNDAPAFCNAGMPMEVEHKFFEVLTRGWPLYHSEERPYYSAQEYNSEQPPAPWLLTDYSPFKNRLNVGVYGRTTFAEFLRICKEIGQLVYLPVEWGQDQVGVRDPRPNATA